MSLKNLKKNNNDQTLSRLVETLVGTISSIVHEMTEDTRALGEIKLSVDELNGNIMTEDNTNSVFVKNLNANSKSDIQRES
jgi:hypothetical protein